MTLKQAILTGVISAVTVCFCLPLFSKMIENAIVERIPPNYARQVGGETFTLILNNCATTFTVFTEHGKPLIVDIERVRNKETTVAFQEMEIEQ